MEIKFTTMIQDQDGNQKTVAYESSEVAMKKLLNVLLAGTDPNHLNDIVIHPVIKK